MSSPEGTFNEANSCSACPVGTFTSGPNDETACDANTGAVAFAKMPDGCKGKLHHERSCDVRKAVDDLLQDYRDHRGIIVSKPSTAGTTSEVLTTYGPMKDWDMSLVTDFSYLFRAKKSMNADLSSWDVSGVTTMYESA